MDEALDKFLEELAKAIGSNPPGLQASISFLRAKLAEVTPKKPVTSPAPEAPNTPAAP